MLVNCAHFARMQPTRAGTSSPARMRGGADRRPQGAARGGVLDGEEAKALRALLAEYGEGRVPASAGRVRGLAAAAAAQSDRCRARAVARAHQRPALRRARLKRQTPVGTHIVDFGRFALRRGE